jgi:hypothetical protein
MTTSDALMNSITNGVGDSSPISRSVDLGCQIHVESDMLSDSSVMRFCALDGRPPTYGSWYLS